MNSRNLRAWLTVATVPAIAIALSLQAGTSAGASSSRGFGATSYGSLSKSPQRVIVMLRGQAGGYGNTAAHLSAIRAEESPILTQLHLAGARNVTVARALPFLIATVTPAERAALSTNPLVASVLTDSKVTLASPSIEHTPVVTGASHAAVKSRRVPTGVCGTPTHPEVDPEALGVIKADQAAAAGYTGAGVTVAYIADGVNPANPDFSRNAAYASGGSPTGSAVLSQVNFTGDPSGTPTAGGEAFLDSSSIAAQGNTVYDLSTVVNPAHPTPSTPCDIKIVGAAPGASVMGLDVFSSDYQTTESNFLQAIDYAVANGVKVLNESFGSNNFPDTSLDATRLADDAAVAAGVTVVVSSGDAGVTSTLGSPSTDPNLISVGATTTFRGYEQVTYGGVNDPHANGTWINNNISSLSSGGFSQGNTTVNLVAPGDLNWALCDANTALYYDCTNYHGTGAPVSLSGGTSESSPLTAGAAADVIQAYRSTHGGAYPTPALVKQILVSTATDISAPAEQQGAGLLNVLGAVRLAASINHATGTHPGGLLISPSQINVTQNAKAATPRTLSLTNSGTKSVKVHLSTRALSTQVADTSSSFCLNATTSTIPGCGPPTPNSFPIWSGANEVYAEQNFTVPAVKGTSRLNFSATYPYIGQSSLLHVALIDPSGAYAGYSLPQGLALYANIQVANPKPGTWTAVFFTYNNAGGGGIGTSGIIGWDASVSKFSSAGPVSPSSVTIPAGATRTVHVVIKSPASPGDTAESIVVSPTGGNVSTVPVTVRSLVATTGGGEFDGVLTGGNGRGNPAQSNTYQFRVPAGKADLDVSAVFGDTNNAVVAYLVDPNGQTVASSSSVTLDSTASNVISTGSVNVYKDAPQAGIWSVVLDWLNPVSGAEISSPFVGSVQFNQVSVSASLPHSAGTKLTAGTPYTYNVTVKNTGLSPQAYFIDPRTPGLVEGQLPDVNGSDQNMTLPLAPGVLPLYVVPSHTSALVTSLTGTVPVGYDVGMYLGDPDVAPGLNAPGVVQSVSGDTASLTLSEPQVSPGLWYLNPSEVGPYGPSGAPSATASTQFDVVTQGFDPTVTSPTNDLWLQWLGGPPVTPVYVAPGASVTIPVTITPTAASGTTVTGTINVSDAFQYNPLIGVPYVSGDELASLPFTYKVQ